MALVEVRESWYGEGSPRRGDTVLYVLVEPFHHLARDFSLPDPRTVGAQARPRVKLVIKGLELPPGSMVVGTVRYYTTAVPHEAPTPSGPPEYVIQASYDSTPDGSRWQGDITGRWPVTVSRVRRKTVWQRLKG